MFNKNKEKVKMVKINIIYDNFVDKYTKKLYKLGKAEVTENRLNEILELEKTTGVKLIEVIDKEYLENNHNDDANIENDTLEGSNIEEGNTIEGKSGDGEKGDETDSKESESSDEGIIDENKNSNDDVAKDTDKKGKSNTMK